MQKHIYDLAKATNRWLAAERSYFAELRRNGKPAERPAANRRIMRSLGRRPNRLHGKQRRTVLRQYGEYVRSELRPAA